MSTDVYQANKEMIVTHNELLFTLKVEAKEGKINNLVCERISNI